MGFLGGIWLCVLGVLGAANLIIARKPEAREWIGKLAPYQGWIGAIAVVFGAWGVLSAVMTIGWMSFIPLYWLTLLATAVVQIALGLLLGVGVIKTFVKSPEAHVKLDQMIAKLAPYQGTLGLVALGLGVWAMLSTLIFSSRIPTVTG